MRNAILIFSIAILNSCINTSERSLNQTDSIHIENEMSQELDLAKTNCSDTINRNLLTKNDKHEYLYNSQLFCGKIVDSIKHREGEQFNYVQSFSYENGILNGSHNIYSYYGDTLLIGQYCDGKKCGIWTEYERNGDIILRGKYVNGKMDSLWTYYFPNDQKISRIENFKMGLKDGVYKSWYSKGLLYTAGFYKNNLKDSVWKTYSNLNYMIDSGAYKNGLKNGIWIIRAANGKYKKVTYKKDTLFEPIFNSNPTGQ